MNCEILQQDIQSLLEYFAKNMYRAKDCENGNDVMHRCNVLLQQDYSVIEISNSTGELSSHYPSTLLIPEYEYKSLSSSTNTQAPTQGPNNGYPTSNTDFLPRSGNLAAELRHQQQQQQSGPAATQQQQQQQPTVPSSGQQQQPQTIYETTYDANKLRDLINKARFARCRARFPLPVILYKGKYICRSATLSGGPEIYGRSGLDYLFYSSDSTATSPTLDEDAYEARETSLSEDTFEEPITNSDWQLFDRVRSQDIKLLKTLNVGTIVDFMVEKKKVKFGMNVTSSEKVDKEKRYAEFKIVSLPYPGCEFFRDYRDNNFSGEGLVFDWSQAHVDASIGVPEDSVTAQLPIDWENYKDWDLVKITQNYLKLLLRYLQDSSSGLLIHCISGWDRTPLFVSLLRLSLWADGAIHQSLSAAQILYFTIAYDWLLFGHNLPDRLNKGEVIFFFCFYALKYIAEDEYSILGQRYKSKHSSGSSSIGVIRTDSESMLDGILLDGESRGSSVSLNSTCSCLSGRSSSQHDTQTCISVGGTAGSGGSGISVTIGGSSFHHADSHNNTSGGRPIVGGYHNPHDDSLNASNGNGWLAHSHDSNSSIGCISNDSTTNLSNHCAWSPQPTRTSPVSVPVASRLRQRQESTSSLSVGSWQMISGTGSLRSSDSATELHNHQHAAAGHQYPHHHHHHHHQHHQSQYHNHVNSNLYGNNHPSSVMYTVGGSGATTDATATTPNANHLHHGHGHAAPHLQHQQQQSQDSSCCTILDDECFNSSYSHDFYAMRRERLNQVRTLFYNCYYSTIAFKFKSVPDSALGSLLGNFAEKVGLAHRTSV
ncbi:myotubularin-related protein 14 [Anopheles ziemanni]|uniref:myotubularin-related protein 14 n=1 Tax=Anopheles coustani TaxID=139045 RepID=UPI0026589864|nr:myotubularin-related protein 14 [Anopheles coustani]XP_058171030.1 myotubularin-related protein 14 [Anopheles ziemanni]